MAKLIKHFGDIRRTHDAQLPTPQRTTCHSTWGVSSVLFWMAEKHSRWLHLSRLWSKAKVRWLSPYVTLLLMSLTPVAMTTQRMEFPNFFSLFGGEGERERGGWVSSCVIDKSLTTNRRVCCKLYAPFHHFPSRLDFFSQVPKTGDETFISIENRGETTLERQRWKDTHGGKERVYFNINCFELPRRARTAREKCARNESCDKTGK